jgi:hypothetical protein
MKDLNSKDDKKVKAALDLADKKGTIDWVLPLLHAFRDRPEGRLREVMREMLSSVKLSDAEDLFISELESGDSVSINADILSFIWSAGFNPSHKLDLVSQVATSGDFRTAMEGLTIIEQCESVEDERVVLESILNVRTAIESNTDKSLLPLYTAMLEALEKLSL